jgi:ornithine cyclodeaminase/alanine dehydrogenase-like protein (mu-crystallin family)
VTDWVLAAERAYVAVAVGPRSVASAPAGHAPSAASASDAQPAATAVTAHAVAAAGAVASRYLAVGTPRSFGIVIDTAAEAEAAALSLVAHRTWFAPRDIRCAAVSSGAAELAETTGGRVVSVDEALACDIVNLYSPAVRLTPDRLRRGTHVNLAGNPALDPELAALATVVAESGLPALAAGLVDGRQLDEITICILDDAPIAAATIDLRQVP